MRPYPVRLLKMYTIWRAAGFGVLRSLRAAAELAATDKRKARQQRAERLSDA